MISTGKSYSAIEVLLVEDSPGDVRLTMEAFKTAKMHINMRVVFDGEEAMEYLRREGKHADAPRPDLILLDLNLPKKDGREVLGEIKGNPALLTIPVVILTTSAAEADILRTYSFGWIPARRDKRSHLRPTTLKWRLRTRAATFGSTQNYSSSVTKSGAEV
jgi:CheY-like chemotaxis protein